MWSRLGAALVPFFGHVLSPGITEALMTLAVALAQSGTQPLISSETAISLVTVVVLIGAAWRLSWLLSRIDARTENLPARVAHIEQQGATTHEKVSLLQQHVLTLEQDVNNLWTAYRGEPPETARRDRPPRAHGERP
jgi:hypothetical protein